MSSSRKIRVPAEEYVIYYPPTDQSDSRITFNCSIITCILCYLTYCASDILQNDNKNHPFSCEGSPSAASVSTCIGHHAARMPIMASESTGRDKTVFVQSTPYRPDNSKCADATSDTQGEYNRVNTQR